MITSINREFAARQRDLREREFILESVLSIDEVLPGSDAEMEDIVDVDSVPDDAYARLDKMLDALVDSDSYDDTEADELADDDIDEDEVSDEELDAIVECFCPEYLGLSESAADNALNYLVAICEAAEETKEDNKPNKKEKIKKGLIKAGKIAGKAAITAAGVYAVSKVPAKMAERDMKNIWDKPKNEGAEPGDDMDEGFGIGFAAGTAVGAHKEYKKDKKAKEAELKERVKALEARASGESAKDETVIGTAVGYHFGKKAGRAGYRAVAGIKEKKNEDAEGDEVVVELEESASELLEAAKEAKSKKRFRDTEAGTRIRAAVDGISVEDQKKADAAAAKLTAALDADDQKAANKAGAEMMRYLNKKKAKKTPKIISALKKWKKGLKTSKTKNESWEGLDPDYIIEAIDSHLLDYQRENMVVEGTGTYAYLRTIAESTMVLDDDEDDLDEGVREGAAEAKKKALEYAEAAKKKASEVKDKASVEYEKAKKAAKAGVDAAKASYKNESTGAYAHLRAIAEGACSGGSCPRGNEDDWDPEEAQDQAHQLGTAKPKAGFEEWKDTSCPYTGEPEEDDNFPRSGNFERPGAGFDD